MRLSAEDHAIQVSRVLDTMASTATMNEWSEQLAYSLLPDRVPKPKLRKHVDLFKRSLRHHTYGSTNQFEIEDRLNGLEEKYQVLNQADLSDALHQRRSELTQHQSRWTPDALDLLLKLSQRPSNYASAERLSMPKEQTAVPAHFKWSDIDAEDPIDRRSRLWRLPDFADSSSDEDEVLPSSADTSPEKETKSAKGASAIAELTIGALRDVVNPALGLDFEKSLSWARAEGSTITEAQAVRELLFTVQGYPTSLFTSVDGQMLPNPRYRLKDLSPRSLDSVLLSVIAIAKAAHSLKEWSAPHQKLPFMHVLEDEIKRILKSFLDIVSELQAQHLRNAKLGGVISLLKITEQLQQASPALQAAQAFLHEVNDQDAISHLDILFEHICRLQHLADSDSHQALMKVFLQTFKSCAREVDHWIGHGTIAEPAGCLFIQRTDQRDKTRFWQSWYRYTESGPNRPPKLFRPCAKQIFTCGKTIAFAKMLDHVSPLLGNNQTLSSIIEAALPASSRSLQPLAATLSDGIAQCMSTSLHSATTLLQTTLQRKCNLIPTLHAFSELYLSGSPLATYIIDARLFSYLDRCQLTWNDRFLISDLLSDVHVDSSLDSDRVAVHSEPISASTLVLTRRSVDVLADISFDYLLPWPIANVILPETLASYRRVSLLLMQIRRAMYVLQRRAHLRLRTFSASQAHFPISRNATRLYTTLLSFTTTLYAHLTSCVISPLTRQLHNAISSSSWTVDDLISLHAAFLHNLEFSCLTTKNLKVLKDTVVALLDLCVEFAFTLSDLQVSAPAPPPTTANDNSNDVEVKIQKMSALFSKQLDFLIAGLRGVARSNTTASTSTSTSTPSSSSSMGSATGLGGALHSSTLKFSSQAAGEMMELLADSLESTLLRRPRL